MQQPYRNALGREHTPQLAAMLLGRPLFSQNPIDQQREIQRQNTLADLIRRRMQS